MTKQGRSPVLGYNHNLRYGGRTFHVQTEDSGQGYARLYTHLFFQGTILSSKKEEYDPAAPEDSVRALMQKLHKAMIKELTHREHDARIGAFFIARGEPAMLEDRLAPVVIEAAPPPAAPPAPVAVAVAHAEVMTSAATVAPPAPPRPTMTPKPVVVVQPAVAR